MQDEVRTHSSKRCLNLGVISGRTLRLHGRGSQLTKAECKGYWLSTRVSIITTKNGLQLTIVR